METGTLIAILALGVGTYLLRVLPLLSKRLRTKGAASSGSASAPGFFASIGPMLIAALLAVSVVPANRALSLSYGLSVVLGLLITGWLFRRYRNFGLAIVAGVVSFGVIQYGIIRWF